MNFMRQNANSWVMILLFAIIIFVFAINFGPWAGNQAPTVPYAAVVNNEAISMSEFRTVYASQFARIKQFRPDYSQEQADADGLRQLVVEQLIARELLYQLGRKHGLVIGARPLAEEIKLRVFGPDDDFDKQEYVRRVNSYFQASIGEFEEQVQKEMVAEQMGNLIMTPVFVSDQEVKDSYVDRNTKIAVEFVKVSPKFFASTRTIPENEVNAFESANGAKISEYYNDHISEFIKPAEVKASHILIKVAQDASETEKTQAKEKAQKILERLKNNEDFASIASAESDDPGSKTKGGDLGYFSEGMMVEEFSKAAFALKTGELSGIVESPFGFHIIKVTDQKPKMEKKLEDVSKEIAETLILKEEQDKKAKELAAHALAQLKADKPLSAVTLAPLSATKLSATASAPNAPIADETDLFSKTANYVGKIGRADEFVEKAFTLSTEQKTAADVIEANGDYFAIRLKNRQEADMTKFEEQKETVRSSLLFPRKRHFMQQYVDALKETAKISYNKALMSAKPMEN